MAPKKNSYKMAIDVYGVRDALTTKNNAQRVAVIDGISSGKIVVIKGVSELLKDIDEEVYKQFQDIPNKKYLKITAAHLSVSASLHDMHGADILGRFPPTERFNAVAACHCEGLDLVSAGKGHAQSQAIVKKCGLNGVSIKKIDEV